MRVLNTAKFYSGKFTPVSEMQLEKLVTKFSRKSCDLDAIPAIVLKECLHDLIPVITKLVNISITDAVVQSSLKMHLLSLVSKRQI